MPIYTLTLKDKTTIANNTTMLHFEKPAGFTFIPGQYGGFTLINPADTDSGGNTRRFSLISSPNDTYLSIATRFQPSAYKRNLLNLPIEGHLKFAGPTGIFTLHDDITIPTVLIAGGIGIAPFYSMIKFATETKSTRPMFLFYGNKSLGDAPLLNELLAFSKQNPYLTLIPVLTNPDEQWQGETGYITHTMLKKYITDINAPIYYICGGPNMVNTLQETLVEMGIDELKIKVEDFPGY